jgi:hypothetical protein
VLEVWVVEVGLVLVVVLVVGVLDVVVVLVAVLVVGVVLVVVLVDEVEVVVAGTQEIVEDATLARSTGRPMAESGVLDVASTPVKVCVCPLVSVTVTWQTSAPAFVIGVTALIPNTMVAVAAATNSLRPVCQPMCAAPAADLHRLSTARQFLMPHAIANLPAATQRRPAGAGECGRAARRRTLDRF